MIDRFTLPWRTVCTANQRGTDKRGHKTEIQSNLGKVTKFWAKLYVYQIYFDTCMIDCISQQPSAIHTITRHGRVNHSIQQNDNQSTTAVVNVHTFRKKNKTKKSSFI